MTTWFGARKATHITTARRKRGRNKDVSDMSIKELLKYMSDRDLCHCFVEKSELVHFVRNVYRKPKYMLTYYVNLEPHVYEKYDIQSRQIKAYGV